MLGYGARMVRYRYETRADSQRREVRRDLIVHWMVGLFLCLTVIGIPFGIIVILVGIHDAQKSRQAIAAAERARHARAVRKRGRERDRALDWFLRG